ETSIRRLSLHDMIYSDCNLHDVNHNDNDGDNNSDNDDDDDKSSCMNDIDYNYDNHSTYNLSFSFGNSDIDNGSGYSSSRCSVKYSINVKYNSSNSYVSSSRSNCRPFSQFSSIRASSLEPCYGTIDHNCKAAANTTNANDF